MLSRQYRLPAKEIPDIAYRGKKITASGFDLRIFYDENLHFPQFAISISTKVAKNATDRNLIKRKFRVAIQELLKQKAVRKAKYLVVVRNAEALPANFTEALGPILL